MACPIVVGHERTGDVHFCDAHHLSHMCLVCVGESVRFDAIGAGKTHSMPIGLAKAADSL